jgi:hypothetical protein
MNDNISNGNRLPDELWRSFMQTGEIGYYMLYNRIRVEN